MFIYNTYIKGLSETDIVNSYNNWVLIFLCAQTILILNLNKWIISSTTSLYVDFIKCNVYNEHVIEIMMET